MNRNHKRLLIIACVVVCFTSISLSLTGCPSIKEFKEVQERANTAANRGYATILRQALNTHNALCDEDKQILELPETIDELSAREMVIAVTMENKDYQEALLYVAFNEEGDAYVIDE